MNSPRAQRRFFIVSAAIFVAGVAVFLGLRVFHNSAQVAKPLNHPPRAGTTPAQVKPSTDAFKVAREFLETAVLQKNMHEAYTLVAAPLKQNVSRKTWESGTNQVVPYPVANAATVPFKVISSTKRKLYMRMDLIPRAGSGQQALGFDMELTKQSDGRWLVDYWLPENPFPVPYGGGSQ